MVPKAIRLPSVFQAICFGFDADGIQLTDELLDEQNNYGKLCKHIIGHSILEILYVKDGSPVAMSPSDFALVSVVKQPSALQVGLMSKDEDGASSSQPRADVTQLE
ncbi:monopolar spindle protein 2 [Striga asiatica]|uniref:Monopolar spindle protein 2 n=1 Tax=Striga asiatica TaxID=4170 RepID=A0A5A7RD45_STRAF|nr:monopolar spindle protein 2 [Striga asiatica]